MSSTKPVVVPSQKKVRKPKVRRTPEQRANEVYGFIARHIGLCQKKAGGLLRNRLTAEVISSPEKASAVIAKFNAFNQALESVLESLKEQK